MGNKVDKTHGGRGQALGSSYDPPKPIKSNKRGQKRTQAQPQRMHHSQEEQRAARSKLVQKKQKHVQSGLDKKEKMLHILDAADAVAQGQEAPAAPKSMQHDTKSTTKPVSKSKTVKAQTQASSESIYMADPSSKEALAAEQRIQQKTKKSINTEERKNRTRDLLFGDGLKIKEDEMDQDNRQNNNNTASSSIYKSDQSIPVSSDSKAANAALARLSQQKNNRIVNSKDRKQRTMQLMHGSLLKDENEVKAAPRESAYSDDLDPEIAAVHQSILNLNNCNAHEKMPPTAKLLRKVVTNLLSAETKEDQDKFGKLRLSNKKIKAAFVDMEYGVEALQSLGFIKKKIYNDKEHKMDDYMLFDFTHINHKLRDALVHFHSPSIRCMYRALCHVMDLLNEYYPEA
eukprot:229706_1